MRIAILDPAAGISGDMTLGALLSLGLPASWLEELPGRLGVGDVGVAVRDVRRAGVTCKQIDFTIPDQPHGRHVGELLKLVERAPISDWVKERALRAFRLVGEAEGRVHGVGSCSRGSRSPQGAARSKERRRRPPARCCCACSQQARRPTGGAWSAVAGGPGSATRSTTRTRCAFSSPKPPARLAAWCCSPLMWTT
ncbi:MAG: hypothetical protein DMD59_00090 [Gemmatimonadetes bacterium]|nr:MAG: hypothetical protein DMD59_00090 [Gemmatimonadota bacterium]